MPESKPPAHLSRESKAWWRTVTGSYALEEWQLRTLRTAAEAWDRLQEARKAIDSDGLTVLDRFGQTRPHPLLAVERDCRIGYLRAVRELALEVDDPVADVRPPRIRGLRSA